MRFALRLLASTLLAIALGLATAWAGVRFFTVASTGIENGPWVTLREAGSAGADMYTRTAVAIGGLLALSRRETVYFNASRDSAGERLSGNCSYRIEGGDPDARWWSITLYADDGYLFDTPTRRYSVSKSNVVRSAGGGFVIRVSSAEEPRNWIAAPPDSFQLSLRLYNPGAAVQENPAGVALPAIVKESCT